MGRRHRQCQQGRNPCALDRTVGSTPTRPTHRISHLLADVVPSMIERKSNPRLQGEAGVLEAIHWFGHNGYRVFVPIGGEGQRYDLIVDRDDNLYRVEVKTTTSRGPSGAWEAHVATRGGNRSGKISNTRLSKADCDLLFIATPDGLWLIPSSEVHNRVMVSVGRKKYGEYRVK